MGVRSYVEWFYGNAHPLGEESRYLNLGYWRDKPATLDEAGEAMAALVGEAAGLGPGDVVLDACCGFGDQDVFWVRRFGPRRIVGSPGTVATWASLSSLPATSDADFSPPRPKKDEIFG